MTTVPYEIRKQGEQFCVYKQDGAKIACHASRSQAEAQRRALYAKEQAQMSGTKTLAQLRDELRDRYALEDSLRHASDRREAAKAATDVDTPVSERAFTVDSHRGSVLITGPAFSIREQANQHANPGFQYLHGRFVEAERANRNGAFWSTEDLQLGKPTVAGGPLNWLHQERHVIGTLLSADLVSPREDAAEYDREVARDFSTKERKKLAGQGKAMKDQSFPIKNEQDLKNAIRLAGNAKDPAAARRHIIRRARALGLTRLIPDSWTKETAAVDIGNHIVADAAVWRFLYPAESDLVQRASESRELWYSMECVSKHVQCMETADHAGCGETFEYATYMTDREKCCEHLRNGGGARRFVEPVFLGGAVILPPVRPGWSNATAEVAREAARVTEQYELANSLTRPEAEGMVAQLLDWANTL